MTDCGDIIVAKVLQESSNQYLVCDPDSLLLFESVYETFTKKLFDIVTLDDPFEFRFVYERSYRNLFDVNIVPHKLIVRSKSSDSEIFPFDLQSRGKIIQISLTDLFPNLSYSAVREVDPTNYNKLKHAYEQFCTQKLGEKASLSFILQIIYEFNIESINTPEDLLHQLLILHYSEITLKEKFIEEIIKNLQNKENLSRWIKPELFKRDFFLIFLQNLWKNYLYEIIENKPHEILLENIDLWIYLDTFLLEGLLKPVEGIDPQKLPQKLRIGVVNIQEDPNQALEDLKRQIINELEKSKNFRDWQRIAYQYARYLYSGIGFTPDGYDKDFQFKLSKNFAEFLLLKYNFLLNNSYLPKPTFLYQIPHFLASLGKKQRIALIIIDGMATHQWLQIQDRLPINLQYDMNIVMAHVPTLTSISRRSIAAGKPADTLGIPLSQYRAEEKLWQRFWAENERLESEVIWKSGINLLKSEEIQSIENLIFGKSMVGLIINTIDDSLHNSQLGWVSVKDLIDRWLDLNLFQELLLYLVNMGYDVWITSDHGNIQTIGSGVLNQGILTEEKSERTRIYSSELIMKDSAQKYSDSIIWPHFSAESGLWPLLSPLTGSFSNEGAISISHGGISIEEVCVPFVNISVKDNG